MDGGAKYALPNISWSTGVRHHPKPPPRRDL